MISSKDVAKRAGVSQATVSRVLNNPERVNNDKRIKVLEAMEQLQYEPNLIARSLVTNKTRTLALVIGTIRNNFFIESMDAIVHAAKKRDYKTMVFFDNSRNLQDILREIKGNQADGILLAHVRMDDPYALEMALSRTPCLFYNRSPQDHQGHFVGMNNRMAGELVTRHLIELGHRRIAVITGESWYSTFHERMQGFRAVMELHSIPVDDRRIEYVDTSGYEVHGAVFRLMQHPEPPSAIVCFSDMIALDCMDSLLSIGYRVPDDVSIAGIDNIRMSRHRSIQLTSVGNQTFNMGELAANTLIDLIEQEQSENVPRKCVIQPELIVRQTTRPYQNKEGSHA